MTSFFYRCKDLADPETRDQGYLLWKGRKVTIDWDESDIIEATVRDLNQRYTLFMQSWDEDDIMHARCDCLNFDIDDICSHIFALVYLVTNERVKFQVPGRGPIVANLDEANADAIDDFKKSRPNKKSIPLWRRFVEDVRNFDFLEDREPQKPAKVYEWWYALVPVEWKRAGRSAASLVVWKRELNKNGQWGKPNQIKIDRLLTSVNYSSQSVDPVAPTPADAEVLRILNAHNNDLTLTYANRHEIYLTPEHSLELWQALAASGRFFLHHSIDSSPDFNDIKTLEIDPSRWVPVISVAQPTPKKPFMVSLAYRRSEDGHIGSGFRSILGNVLLDNNRILMLSHQVDQFGRNFRQTESLFEIPASDFDAFMSGLDKAVLPCPLVLDAKASGWQEVEVKPRCQILIDELPEEGGAGSPSKSAKVLFSYLGREFRLGSEITMMSDVEHKTYWSRDLAFEEKSCDDLYASHFVRLYKDAGADFVIKSDQVIESLLTLIEKGWDVFIAARKLRSSSSFNIKFKSNIDWFEIDKDAPILEGVSLPSILEATRKNASLIQASDGSSILFPAQLRQKLELLLRMGQGSKTNIRFQKNQAILLDALLSNGSEQKSLLPDEIIEKAKEKNALQQLGRPRNFVGTLRPYQIESLSWFQYLFDVGLGGCLADDMGLGKTIQVLAWLQNRAIKSKKTERRPNLLVLPRSLIHNWQREIRQFTPSLKACDVSQNDGVDLNTAYQQYDILLVTYGVLRQRIETFKDLDFQYVILDEAQNIKNRDSQSAKAVRLLRGQHRLALTGTPVENHLSDLWSIFEFLNPGMLGKASGYENWQGPEAALTLGKALAPLILRRTKEQVLKDLPAKSEQLLLCPLEGAQKKVYSEIRDYYKAVLDKKVKSEGFGKSKIHILEALLRLRQAACHPALLNPTDNLINSSKIDLLMEHLLELASIGRKSLVFSQFTSLLSLVKDRLDNYQISYEYLDGKTKDRAGAVQRFQNNPKKQVFLLSLKAGGVGLNLTAAEYCFILDPWWNPAAEAQAVDRAHRIGQDKPVFVYRLVCEDTVEEKILELQARKKDLAKSIISNDNSLLRTLTSDDLAVLLN